MGMLVAHWLVAVPMRVRLGYRTIMNMLVVRIVHMRVLMLKRLMVVIMFMPFSQMQHQAERH